MLPMYRVREPGAGERRRHRRRREGSEAVLTGDTTVAQPISRALANDISRDDQCPLHAAADVWHSRQNHSPDIEGCQETIEMRALLTKSMLSEIGESKTDVNAIRHNELDLRRRLQLAVADP